MRPLIWCGRRDRTRPRCASSSDRSRRTASTSETGYRQARDFDLDLKPEQVKVQVLRRDNRIIVDVEYEQTVELPFYTHTLVFKPHLTGSVY